MVTRRPAEQFPPGDFIREELEERGWTQEDLAEILERPLRTVNQLITGKQSITRRTAAELAAVFGTSAEYWLNLENAYRLWLDPVPDSGIARRARLYAYAPVLDMVKRGWIAGSRDIETMERQVCSFFDVGGLDEQPQLLKHAARKSTSYTEKPTPAQMAWLFRAMYISRSVQAKKFAPQNIEGVVEQLKRLAQAPEELRHVARILSEGGIRFVVVQPLPGMKMDGACLWLSDDRPVIALSLRFDRIDNFWFCLLHEIGHCLQGVAAVDADTDTQADGTNDKEREADAFAAQHSVDQAALNDFVIRKRPFYSTRHIQAFAYMQHVHPGIVVGQLHRRGEVDYKNFRDMLAPIRQRIIGSAITDGWGVIAPTPASQ